MTNHLSAWQPAGSTVVVACVEWVHGPASPSSDVLDGRNHYREEDSLLAEITALKAEFGSLRDQLQSTSKILTKLLSIFGGARLTDCDENREHAAVEASTLLQNALDTKAVVLEDSSHTSQDHSNSPACGKGSILPEMTHGPRAVKIKYNNPDGASKTTFSIRTWWRNVKWSRTYLCSLPSLDSCSGLISDMVEITQNTEFDWLDCTIGVQVGKSQKTFPNQNCRRSIPHELIVSLFGVRSQVLLDRDGVEWALKLEETSKDALKFTPGYDITLCVAGQLLGKFKPTWSDNNNFATIEIRKPDNTITKPC